MGCRIKTNRHRYLAYRLFWNNITSWEGTGLKDTAPNREKLRARAQVIDQAHAQALAV